MKLMETQILEVARYLAAKGQHRLALTMLDLVRDEDANTRVWMLQGKILAQMERYAEAVVQWEKILALRPDDPQARAAIEKAKERQQHPTAGKLKVRALRLSLAMLLGVLLLGTVFLAGRISAPREKPDPKAAEMALQRQLANAVDSAVSRGLAAAATAAAGEMEARLLPDVRSLQSQVRMLSAQVKEAQGNIVQDTLAAALKASGEHQRGLSALGAELAKTRDDEQRVLTLTRDLQTSLGMQWAAWHKKSDALRDQVQAVLARQALLESEQAESKNNFKVLTRSVQSLEMNLTRLTTESLKQQSRAAVLLYSTLLALKPGYVVRLADQIEEAKNKVARLAAEETQLRTSKGVVSTFRHRQAEDKLHEAQTQLEVLQADWQERAAPWLRAQEIVEQSLRLQGADTKEQK